jgi:hypothetical protein
MKPYDRELAKKGEVKLGRMTKKLSDVTALTLANAVGITLQRARTLLRNDEAYRKFMAEKKKVLDASMAEVMDNLLAGLKDKNIRPNQAKDLSIAYGVVFDKVYPKAEVSSPIQQQINVLGENKKITVRYPNYGVGTGQPVESRPALNINADEVREVK